MTETNERWIEIDARGAALAGQQGALDVEIGEWLLAARDAEVHRHIGYGSFAEYVERRLGLAPHAAAERIRVAESLAALGQTREALRSGALSFSVARELSRVAVPETEREWLDAASHRSARQVEQLVSGRRPGQRPSDPADPRLRRYALHFDVGAETYALWREAVRVLQRTVDPSLSEQEALQAMCRQVLAGPGDEGRSPYQVAITRCEDCDRAFQQARGEPVEVTPELLERLECDAQHVGSVDDASHVGRSAPRATQTIPPAIRRKVIRRDHGRCRVPGCRNATWLEVAWRSGARGAARSLPPRNATPARRRWRPRPMNTGGAANRPLHRSPRMPVNCIASGSLSSLEGRLGSPRRPSNRRCSSRRPRSTRRHRNPRRHSRRSSRTR